MDKHYMQMALDLAMKGQGNVSPNPLVGAVIIKDGKVIGKGCHEEYGKNHAEINAINDAKESVEGATLYVNLEPCTVYGNTPPCADRIIEEKFKRVVIAQKDPNPQVNGKGIKKMKNAGIEVKIGVLEEEAKRLNIFYNNFMTKKRSFFTLKAAMTLDGKLADLRGDSNWITNEKSREYAMYLRFINDAVLVGAQTVRHDNPHLNVRGYDKKRPFYKIIVSKNLDIPGDSNVFKTGGNTLIFCGKNANSEKIKHLKTLDAKVFVNKKSENVSIKLLANTFYEMKIQSVLVEGGASVFSQFIDQNYVDRLALFYAPKIFGKGIPAFGKITPKYVNDPLKVDIEKWEKFDDDFFIQGTICSQD
ncbi:MAG: bifunctional diaminohydroxyphosphoribosylaminopyrimidine deaminase/5-amino-6-(5-phosphoribosylamino)uracil reductase RibD [Proteobacteria bacterium]|nr:bifunctional diaminohydroxyphosphoribosylaminopyrimidine deaminase/5-amino-6-(5-phosphoribosylamino)uracil reductase RibD [Pseudomonadota bacterium]